MKRFLGALLCMVLLVALSGCGDNDNDTIENVPPVADAGIDQSVTTGSVVTLDGSASNDQNGDLLSYRWSLASRPVGSSAALSDSVLVKPTFTADLDGVYVYELIVNDGHVDSPMASVTVTAETANSAPVANAGPDQNVTTGGLVTLNGIASNDANGDLLSYRWRLVSRPAGSAAVLAATTVVRPTFTADVDGIYVCELIVNDGQVDSAADTVNVTAETANSVPVANAGTDETVTTGALVTLDGSASTDADGDPLGYRWSLISLPTGSSAALSSATAVGPTFTADVAGVYIGQLIVNDGSVDSVADTVTITAVTPPLILSGRWTTPVSLQSDVGYHNTRPHAAVNASGAGAVSWSQGNPYYENATLVNLFDPNGGAWIDPAVVSPLSIGAADPAGGSESSPAIDDAGHVMVAREVVPATGANQVMVYAYDPLAATWDVGTAMETVPEMSVDCQLAFSGNSPNASYPDMQMNGAGEGIVAWENLCVSSYGWYTNIYVSLYDPAADLWSQGVRLDNYYNGSHLPVVAIGTSGQAAVAWWNDPPAWSGAPAEGLYASVYNVATGNWTTSEIATVATYGSISEYVLSVDDAGHVTAVWRAALQLYWARYDPALQQWSAPQRLDSAPDSADQPAIAVDGQGNVLVTWRQSANSIMSRRYVQATDSWGAPVLLALGLNNPVNAGLGVDASGNAIAFFAYGGHPYAMRHNVLTGTWYSLNRLDSYESTILIDSLSLAVSASGEAMATWIQSPDHTNTLRPLVFASRLE